MNTMVVNCYAGPGAGKTTCAGSCVTTQEKGITGNMFLVCQGTGLGGKI